MSKLKSKFIFHYFCILSYQVLLKQIHTIFILFVMNFMKQHVIATQIEPVSENITFHPC